MSRSGGRRRRETPGGRQACGIQAHPTIHRLRGGAGMPLGPAPGPRSRPSVLETRCTKLPSPLAQLRRSDFSAHWRAQSCPPGTVPSSRPPSAPRLWDPRGPAGRARPYLFQVALAQARRCCVPRSSAAAAAAGSLLPRSLRLGELMNFNLRRVLMVTSPGGGLSAHARSAPRPAPRRAAGPGRRCALYEETWAKAGSRAALPGPAPAPRLRPRPRAGRRAGLIISPNGRGAQRPELGGYGADPAQKGPGGGAGPRGRGAGPGAGRGRGL